MKLCLTSNKCPQSTQGAYFRSHAWSANQRVQISQGLLIDIPNHHTFYTHSTVYKKIGSRSVVPYSAKIYDFYMSSTTYKKQGAPDRRSLTQQKCMFFTCVAPCTKRKGLHRYVLQIYYFINQVFKSFCSSACIIIVGLALP
jgi:hypothetical protein